MLKRLQESLPDKLVLQIPTAIFASYDAIGAIKFIQNEIENYNNQKKKNKLKNVTVVKNLITYSFCCFINQ